MKSFWLKSRFALVLNILLLLTLIGLLLIPFATNGMWYDDAIYVQTWDLLQRFHLKLGFFSLNMVKLWLYGNSRLLLSFFPIYGFFYLFKGNTEISRLVDISFVLINIATVIYLLRLVRIPWRSIGCFVLILISLFQIRPCYDPIASYAVLFKLLAFAITISLILLVKWQQTGRTSYLAISNLIILISLFCYELNILYYPIAVVTILTAPYAKRLKNLLITILPLVLYITCVCLIRSYNTNLYPGTTFGSLRGMPITYLKQLVGSFPGSFYLMYGHNDYHFSVLIKALISSKIAWLIAALSLLCSYFIVGFQTNEKSHPEVSKGLIATALVFVVLTPFLIAFSLKYQLELMWGLPYLPVYYQYFGLALLLALSLQRLMIKRQQLVLIVIVPLFSLYTTLNWISNKNEMAKHESFYTEPIHSLGRALDKGLLDVVRDGDILELKDLPFYINGNLFYRMAGKNLSIPSDMWVIKPRKDAICYQLSGPVAGDKESVWQLILKK
ncbi:MAG: hypothetical protein H0U73_09370 [Tatlockia sp.]|nr:hypothetical protein [Tatlockia sp.]